MIEKFKGLLKLLQSNPSEQECIDYYEKIIWKGKTPVSPFDPTSKVWKCADQITKSKNPVKYTRYQCKNTGKYFNVKTKTIFENSKIPLKKWFWALYFLSKGGICSYKLADHISISVTQKTAWLMDHKLRRAFKCPLFDKKLEGVIEIDENYQGGSNPNRHWNKKAPKAQGRNWKDKIVIWAGVERDSGNMIAKISPNAKRDELEPLARENIKEGSIVCADEYNVYDNLYKWFVLQRVNHGIGQYVNAKTSAKASTNVVENRWSHLNRMIYGIYIRISRKHAQKYVDEFVFRNNTRKYSDEERCELILSLTVGKRITYQQLIS